MLDIDSPGGEAGGVFDLADKIFSARKVKPIWAVANDEAFSAAYAIAAAR
jgi:ClpP class serine protease